MSKALLLKLILALSNQYNLDPKLVQAIVEVESQFNVERTGSIGERGLMQLHPKYFEGDQYYDPLINLSAGVKYLAAVRKRCSHKSDHTYVVCYNLGVRRASLIKYPEQQTYYKKVMGVYASLKVVETASR